MMLMESVAVLDGVNGNHLISPAVDVFQPEQQTMAHLMEVLLITHESVNNLTLTFRNYFNPKQFTFGI